MSNFLNHDFGSEDEDDDFNPAPVDESDAEDSKVSDGPGKELRGQGADTRWNSLPRSIMTNRHPTETAT